MPCIFWDESPRPPRVLSRPNVRGSAKTRSATTRAMTKIPTKVTESSPRQVTSVCIYRGPTLGRLALNHSQTCRTPRSQNFPRSRRDHYDIGFSKLSFALTWRKFILVDDGAGAAVAPEAPTDSQQPHVGAATALFGECSRISSVSVFRDCCSESDSHPVEEELLLNPSVRIDVDYFDSLFQCSTEGRYHESTAVQLGLQINDS